jgi:hypothetical protein
MSENNSGVSRPDDKKNEKHIQDINILFWSVFQIVLNAISTFPHAHRPWHISCCALSGFSCPCFQMILVSNFVHINKI